MELSTQKPPSNALSSLLENGFEMTDDEEVIAAAKAACCDEFIRKLPDGYNTSAGEAGKRLSGGERQRIAIARMMLKNAPVVILDEATAFTDPENETKLQESIANLTRGKTLLVIAHRLSTIKNADEILVTDGAKSDSANLQEIFSDDAVVLVTDPVYPVYVDSNIMAGRDIVYAPSTEENGFCAMPPSVIVRAAKSVILRFIVILVFSSFISCAKVQRICKTNLIPCFTDFC